MRTLIIPDIHGCSKTLRYLLEVRLGITVNDRLYFLGDYVDRGPDTPGVIDYLVELKRNDFKLTCLKGNHEQMLLNSINGDYEMSLWLMNGGMMTLHQYQKQTTQIETEYGFLPQSHLDFLNSLHSYALIGQCILVHGGINYSAQNPFSDEEALLWNRPVAVPDDFMPGYRIICGHTPYALSKIIQEIKSPHRRLFNLDAGCVYKGQTFPGTGYLTALCLETWELEFVECLD